MTTPQNTTATSLALAALLPLGLLASPTASAADIDSVWSARGDGSWNVAGNWSPKGIPNNGSGNLYSVFIQSGALVTINTSVTASNLTLGLSDHLRITNLRILTIDGALGNGAIDNGGLIEVSSTGSSTRLEIANDLATLTGGGTVRLVGSGAWLRRGAAGGALLNLDNTIEGSGNLGWATNPMAITNHALVRANAAATLGVQPGTATFTNSGVLQAIDGATLQLNGGTYLNDGGLIEALDGSTVELDGNASIFGGTLFSEGSGLFRVTSSTPRLEDVVLDGNLRITNLRILTASGSLVNLGEILINSSGSNTYFRPVDGELVLTGGGTIRMSDSSSNWIYRDSADASLRNVDNVIEGAGNLGWSSAAMPITNEHIVRANLPTRLDVQPGSSLFTNSGTMEATDGGTLRLNGGTYANVGGSIEALAGSTVELDGNANIVGGSLVTDGDGILVVTSSTPRLDDVVLDGNLRINNLRILTASGSLVNLGEILVNSSSGSTYFRPVDGELVLTGGGTIRMSDSSSNWIYRDSADASLRNVDNVIEGAGNLGWSTAPTPITNEHVVRANLTNPLVVQPGSATFTNSGLMQATDGATLRLNGGTYVNAGGTIEALAGSTVELNGNAEIIGGTIVTEGDGVIRVTLGTPRLENLVLAGDLRINNLRTMQATGVIENSGEIRIASTGSSTYLRPIGGELTLTGGGTVRMTDNSSNWFYRDDADSFVRNVDNTIRGGGNLGWTGARTGFINETDATILADSPVLLRIAPDAEIGLVNDGLLRVEGSGGAEITGGAMDQRGSVIVDPTRSLARAGGNYLQTDGTTTVRGTLSVSGSGNAVRLEGGTLLGDGLVTGPIQNVGGVIAPGLSIGTLSHSGLYTQSGTGVLEIEIDGPRSNDLLAINGNAQLGGFLSPLFDDDYTPTVGEEWTILTANAVSGSFNAVEPCERIKVIYDADGVRIQYTGTLKIADLNCDGVVNGADLGILLSSWGQCVDGALCPADLNGDGVVDGADLGILLSNWG